MADAITLQLLDRQLITDVIHDYAMGVDTHDYERLLSCFLQTPEARMINAKAMVEGIDAIRAAMSPEALAKARAANSGLQFDKSTHQMSNIMITLEGDAAHAESAAVVFLIGPLDGGESLVVRGVRYVDDFVRVADGWRIRSRTHSSQWQFGPVPLAG